MRADGVLQQDWDTMEDFLAQISQPPRPETYERARTSTSCTSIAGVSPEWYGTASYEEALSKAINGCPDTLSRIEKSKASLKFTPVSEMSERMGFNYADSGDEVCVSRWMEGDSDHMLEFVPQVVPASGRVVKLVCNVSASSGINTESIFRRGAAAVLLADAIENSGLRCEIIMAGDTSQIVRRVGIKSADQPTELDRIAFMLTSASVQRRFMFRIDEQLSLDEFQKRADGGGGTPVNAQIEGDDVIMVDTLQWGFGNQLNTDADAIAFVQKILAKHLTPEMAQ